MKTENPERGFQKKKNNERFSLVRKHKAKLECLKKKQTNKITYSFSQHGNSARK